MDTNYLIAYGLMLLFVAASFVMTSRQHQRLRRICDPFGLAFTEAAVYAIGQTNPDCKLACDEHSLPLPLHEQPANGFLHAARTTIVKNGMKRCCMS